MNPWFQIINTTIFIIGLIPCIGFSIHMANILAQRLPGQQLQTLEQFARMAVLQVEQQYPGNQSKKVLAQASIATLFKAFNLPVPSAEAVDIAIEAAVRELVRLDIEK